KLHGDRSDPGSYGGPRRLSAPKLPDSEQIRLVCCHPWQHTVPAWQSRRASDSVLVGEGEQPGMARLYPFRWVGEVPLFALNLAD
ncbi:hypothetical protein, partial [Stenotrophomonas maltophilia]|uniref:hypothetical protein n=1 Tax=Stenotrophomonas maltophilia TaxID=40324 RepID=UPI003BAA2C7E